MDLSELRNQIDSIDKELVRLFAERMQCSAQVAEYKRSINMPVFDPVRERALLKRVGEMMPDGMDEYAISLYSVILELSRSSQNRILGRKNEIVEQIEGAIKNTNPLFPINPMVACQGVEGAYSTIACERLFARPDIMYFSSFDKVFTAIEKGMCQYGMIPVENSTAGSVNAAYDLMMKHDFKIVRSVRIKIEHNLMVKPGTKLSEIKEIYSHEQAISQCQGYLSKLPGVRVIACANTAMAAKMVAESDRGDIAAISSRNCAKLYGLECLDSAIQDQGNNYTRFICITKNLEIYPGADRTSLMMVVSHRPGSLYKVLSRFNALGINLIKLESRTIPGRNFEFMFYFDLETSVYSPNFIQLMGELNDVCEEFNYLGSYSEIV